LKSNEIKRLAEKRGTEVPKDLPDRHPKQDHVDKHLAWAKTEKNPGNSSGTKPSADDHAKA